MLGSGFTSALSHALLRGNLRNYLTTVAYWIEMVMPTARSGVQTTSMKRRKSQVVQRTWHMYVFRGCKTA